MKRTKLTSAALAASLILLPAERATADAKDFIVGAIIGGVVGSQIQKQQQKKRQVTTRYRAAPKATAKRTVRATPKKSYRPSIPATTEGRQIQSSLNYFGFDAGAVDGRVGNRTRSAISQYQAYMGYPATGMLNAFEQELLVSSYNRALAGGQQTFAQIAGLPEGTRGLLRLYRADIAATGRNAPAVTPQALPGNYETITDL